MKKVILGSLSVLSLSLFSFTLPGEQNGVVKTDDGNFEVAEGATQKFTPADQQFVSSTLMKMYNIETSAGTQKVTMQKASGSYEFMDQYLFELAAYTKIWRGVAFSVALVKGSDAERLVATFDRYAAQP